MSKIKNIFLLSLTSLMAFQIAVSDEITKAIDEAKDQYNKGSYSEALDTLNNVIKQISEKSSNKLTEFLPKSSGDFKQTEIEVQDVNAGLLGLGNSVTANYSSDSGEMKVTVTANSPMIEMLSAYTKNPAILQMSGLKLEEINGQQSIINFKEGATNGTVQVLIGKQGLVAINGSGVSLQDIKDLMKKIEFKKLSKFMVQE